MLPVPSSPNLLASPGLDLAAAAPINDNAMIALGAIDPQHEPRMCSRFKASIAHAMRDYVGQGCGRLASAGTYCVLATLDEVGLRIAAGVFGSLIGGRLFYRMAAAQIGTETRSQQAGVAFCTLLGAAAGGSISALGSTAIVASVGAFALLTASASLAKREADDPQARERAEGIMISAATLGTVGGLLVGSLDPRWQVDSHLLPARNLGLVVESTVIEIGKSMFEQLGPSVDRQALNFEGRVMVALSGMVPYVAATVLLNGYVAGQLQPGYDSIRFRDLIGPALVGAIANAVRGASNALLVALLHRRQRFAAADERACLRAGTGIRRPRPRTVSDKACVRYFLSACRNAMYARLRDANYSVTDANMISQGVYACFAQCRDLIADLIKGDGWTEPQLRTRATLSEGSRTRSVNVEIDKATSVELSKEQYVNNSFANGTVY